MKRWRWWRKESLPEDTKVGAGHSIIWFNPKLFPEASKWHDTTGHDLLHKGEITVAEWNETFRDMAEEERKENPSAWKRLALKPVVKLAYEITKQFAKLRYGTKEYIVPNRAEKLRQLGEATRETP